MAKAPNGERVLAFKGDSLESLTGLLARGLTSMFDAVYVDASHEVRWKTVSLEEARVFQYFLPSSNARPFFFLQFLLK